MFKNLFRQLVRDGVELDEDMHLAHKMVRIEENVKIEQVLRDSYIEEMQILSPELAALLRARFSPPEQQAPEAAAADAENPQKRSRSAMEGSSAQEDQEDDVDPAQAAIGPAPRKQLSVPQTSATLCKHQADLP